MAIKPIETAYNGYRFRSRLEARTAVFLDAAKIPYIYEPEGILFEDGTTYLPDFYLPNQETFLECKGIMNKKDEHKIMQLAKATKKGIVVVNADMSIDFAEYADDISDYLPDAEKKESVWFDGAVLGECNKCGKKFFFPVNGSWQCLCCGYYSGDNTAEWLYERDYDRGYEPLKKAKSARFEHGEAG